MQSLLRPMQNQIRPDTQHWCKKSACLLSCVKFCELTSTVC
jgi:hypothetical protein